jgi:hypothetical protein
MFFYVILFNFNIILTTKKTKSLILHQKIILKPYYYIIIRYAIKSLLYCLFSLVKMNQRTNLLNQRSSEIDLRSSEMNQRTNLMNQRTNSCYLFAL